MGRFLSADPVVEVLDNLQTYNRYSYVRNNPLTFTDPSGFESSPGDGDSAFSGSIDSGFLASAFGDLGSGFDGVNISNLGQQVETSHNTHSPNGNSAQIQNTGQPLQSTTQQVWSAGLVVESNTNTPTEANHYSNKTINGLSSFVTGMGKEAWNTAVGLEELGIWLAARQLGVQTNDPLISPYLSLSHMRLNIRPGAENYGSWTMFAILMIAPMPKVGAFGRGKGWVSEISAFKSHRVTSSKITFGGIQKNVNPNSLIGRQTPAEMTGSRIKRIYKSMKKDGYTGNPVEYANVEGKRIIIDGHHRVSAARKAGLASIPGVEVVVSKQFGNQLLRDAAEALMYRK